MLHFFEPALLKLDGVVNVERGLRLHCFQFNLVYVNINRLCINIEENRLNPLPTGGSDFGLVAEGGMWPFD